MNAFRQIVEVKNRKINFELPENFVGEKVEIIIFPVEEEEDLYFISEEEKELMRERLKNTKESEFEDWDTIKHNFL